MYLEDVMNQSNTSNLLLKIENSWLDSGMMI